MIQLRGISKNFDSFAAVRDVSWKVKTGEKCCLIGPTGSGKTTLLRLIAGLEQPDQGEILIDGRLVSSEKLMVAPHLRKIGMIFQGLAIWPHLTVLKHLTMVMNSQVNRRQREAQALDILTSLELAELSQSYPGMLSGGQRQKLAIARLLAGRPKIALCDEPYVHLDLASKEAIKQVVSRWLAENRITLIMVTHDPLEDFSFFDSVGVIQQGSLVAWDKPGALQNLLKKMDLGVEVS